MARPRNFDTERVLDDATERFWHRGYAATSVQDLVDATGVNRASLYNAFGDKHALFLTLLRRYTDRRIRRARDLLTDDSVAPQLAVRAFLEEIAEELTARPRRRGCLLVNAVTERGAYDRDVERIATTYFERLEDAFAFALRRDSSLQAKAVAHARFLATSLQGVCVVAKTAPGRPALQDAVEGMIRGVK